MEVTLPDSGLTQTELIPRDYLPQIQIFILLDQVRFVRFNSDSEGLFVNLTIATEQVGKYQGGLR